MPLDLGDDGRGERQHTRMAVLCPRYVCRAGVKIEIAVMSELDSLMQKSEYDKMVGKV